MTEHLLLWISQNSQWAALVVMSIAFFEPPALDKAEPTPELRPSLSD